jgi:RimJ/RimL family protein N-acetyltransferase
MAMTSLQDFDRPGTSAEWGRLCARTIGSNGHAILEGCYLLHRMLFDALGMFRLIGTVATTNKRPYRLYKFFGYQDEGLRRKHWVYADGYFDVIEIGLFEEEWDAAKGAIEAKLYPDGDVPVITPEQAAAIRERIPLEGRG